ncbi:MAG: hypothetical protein ABI969_06975, partial [bacterium]
MEKMTFRGARQKIKRATVHIDALETEVEKFRQTQPVRIVVQQYARSRTWTVLIASRAPLGLSLILGDAIHNLRASLDLLAAEYVPNDR